MRKISLLLLAFGLLAPGLQAQKKNTIDEVIWIVGDEAILKSDVEALILDAQMRRQPIQGDAYCVIPEQMAIQKLFLHQAALDSVTVNEGYIASLAEADLNKYIADVGSVEKAEEYSHKTVAQLREIIREKYKSQALIEQMQSQLVSGIQATPAEVRRYFSNISKDSLPTIPEQVELQVLSVNPPIPLAEVNRVKEKLREFTERATANPADFSLLARLYSEDPGSAVKGGEIGYTARATLDPEFAAVAFNLQDPKKVSRIVESQFGFHIIQLIGKRGDKVNCRHILLKPRASIEDKQNGITRLDSLADLIRQNKITFEQAVMHYSQDKNTAMNAGLMVNQNTGNSKFEYQDLPSEVAKAAYDMNVGEVSKAFTMIDPLTGKEMITIVKLKSKTPTHKANIMDDYQVLKNIMEGNKKQEFLHNWISKKQKETYISIKPEWRNCNFQYKGWIKD
ncbi:MAG: PpiC-type peptidyl-prolyl cis-trans isomerase [Bacteroidetes bacterium]|nr:PpiC-type peptidyl-prolyl cis-trans isomerase [Bacteroidota bacterium]